LHKNPAGYHPPRTRVGAFGSAPPYRLGDIVAETADPTSDLLRAQMAQPHDQIEPVAQQISSPDPDGVGMWRGRTHARACRPESFRARVRASPDPSGFGEALVRSGREPSALHNNCSGKHAGLLCTACALGGGLWKAPPISIRLPVHIRARIARAGDEHDADAPGLYRTGSLPPPSLPALLAQMGLTKASESSG
jgi:hypothetical protein